MKNAGCEWGREFDHENTKTRAAFDKRENQSNVKMENEDEPESCGAEVAIFRHRKNRALKFKLK